tara:strand:- start:198 stop:755 length:558 start_codon:yes stop_codon:yes gene_type:complete
MSPFDVAWTFLKHDNITKFDFNLSNWLTAKLAGMTAGSSKPAARGPVVGSEDWYSQNRPRVLNYDMSDYRDRGYDIDNRPYGYTPSSPFEYNTGSDMTGPVEGPEVQDDGRVIYGGGTAYSDDAADYRKITQSRELLADEEAYQQRLEEERQLQEEERKRAEQEQAEQQQQQHDGTMPGGGVTVI